MPLMTAKVNVSGMGQDDPAGRPSEVWILQGINALGSHGQPPELLAAANAREFVLVAAQQEKPSSSPPCASRRTGGLVEIAEDKVLVTGLKGPLEQGWQQKAEAFVAPHPLQG